MVEEGVEAVAVCLLHSYANANHENRVRELAEQMGLKLYLSLSSSISPELGEYERMTTTAANAYIQPIAEGYLAELQDALQEMGHGGRFYLMWSDGGLASVEATLEMPIRLLESGPAAGALAVRHLAKDLGLERALAFDMGGTTAKICLIRDFEPGRSPSFEIGRVHRNKPGSGATVKVPSIHMLEIGAGGGSIGQLDDLGLLKVGPGSAGADPGPACYGLGGTKPTVTDANLLLGYLSEESTLAGGLELSKEKAEGAASTLGEAAGLEPHDIAVGIRRIVTENMAQAAQLHVTELGEDPRKYTLVAFGGAAPLHAFDIAKSLGIRQVVLPGRAGVLSAFGFLTAKVGLERVQSFVSSVAELDTDALSAVMNDLRTKAVETLVSGGVPVEEMDFEFALDMRYRGQGYDVQVPALPGQLSHEHLQETFRTAYARRYGQGQEGVVEVRACRLSAHGQEPKMIADKRAARGASESVTKTRQVWFADVGGWLETRRHDLGRPRGRGVEYAGPLLVEAHRTPAMSSVKAEAYSSTGRATSL